ncbi:MAG: sodium:solute symporter, partial [Muribaculaceae bacterium]|nr:sodium:solute symporter [Muribaculaceae bacterium]
MPVIVILTIAAYFLLLMLVGRLSSRGADNSTFFTGGRTAPWPVVAFAMVGAMISGVTFISVPGMVVGKGYAYLQMVLGFIVGYVVIAFVLVPLFYRRNLISIYGYLEERFGRGTYRTGAWFFFASKMLGAAVRFFVVCAVLQLLVFEPLHIPFIFNVAVTIALIWLYTVNGGVKTLIWTDTLKSFCLIASVVLCIYFVARNLGMDFGGMVSAIGSHHTSRMFFFDDPLAGTYFWKQFIAGVFMAIATNGLDQDMMQRNLACRDSRQSQKNMIVSGVTQFFVIALFLLLGTLLVIFLERNGIAIPEKTDDIFGLVATHNAMPAIVGILFVLGLVSAAYSAAGSALTSLTTSFTVDILGAHRTKADDALTRTRRRVHVGMSVVMGLIIVAFYYLSNQDAISAVYTLASYTYGPILGLFVFGLALRRPVRDRFVPVACIAAPVLSW